MLLLYRVILVAGPEDEVKVARWIYREFQEGGKAESERRLATFWLRNEAYNATLRK
jgi:hypothetical protein